jgi:hypothetical protein
MNKKSLRFDFLAKIITQCGGRTHDPRIRSPML